MNSLEARITELETKVAYQDETIDILNDELKQHQMAMAKITRQIELVGEKLKEIKPSSVVSEEHETLPPHY
ncbi:SlyX family protein [Pseudoalteromonas sp. G4]|uniref:SlyX family protein n=1 Tax=Pseudoalteromonas sp. G4 TaxID=2992761 RepID=UPI00237E3065|nr:SlyX family protein [Pseudoalteromonas sp. G4]MDE3273820.1 SlyX family protein [Pseudoalteromonas sp. G4]